jgi:hypothetical protein
LELRVAEQRYRAVWEVLEGASVMEVARRFKVPRQSVHTGCDGMPPIRGWVIGRRGRMAVRIRSDEPVTEAKIVEIGRAHPAWGADRIGYQPERDGVSLVPGRTSINRGVYQACSSVKRRG